ncbi:MAG: Heme/hemopexin transporter protein HuxB [Candidatus Anoxychlamydiales bacterium]|nr:Heme/hemopexin transporter protein HuxB [Candidatus Anoxychlamydiales bacterium]
MTKLFFIIAILFSYVVFSQEESISSDLNKNCEIREEEENLPLLKSIILTSQEIDVDKECENICIEDLAIAHCKKDLEKRLDKYLNSPITDRLVNDIKNDIIKFYQDQKLPFVMIDTPNQDVTNGRVYFLITESKLGKIHVKTQKWTKPEQVKEYIRLKPDEPIKSDVLVKDLYWINQNPFRQASAIYSPGEKTNTTDIEINVKDRLPVRPYAGVDNTGNDVTGNTRVFAGILANTYKNQLLAYQYITATTLKEYQAHIFKYTVPLPWRDSLELIAAYSSFDVDYSVTGLSGLFHSDGMNLQVSAHYDIPIFVLQYLGEVILGFDFKRTNNNVTFSAAPVFGAYANLTQFMLAYNMGGLVKKGLEYNFYIEGFYSPGRWVSDQSNAKYRTIRAFAKNHYVYARSAVEVNYTLPKDFVIASYLRWQLSNQNLLPSETYGLGGYNTVRGYKEAIYNADLAILYNLSLRTPSIKKKYGNFIFLTFFDLANGWKNHKAGAEKKSQLLYSIGPGVRYNFSSYVSARLDWGVQLKNISQQRSHNRFHFSVVAGY